MKVAYLILAHKNPSQLSRLVGKLLSAGDDVFIHIDAGIDIRPFSDACGRQGFMIPSRKRIYWAGFSIVEATLLLMRSACARKSYDYFCLLSGFDYPIKPLAEFRAFLKKNEGREFIDANNLLQTRPADAVRYQKFRIACPGNAVTRIAQRMVDGAGFKREMYGGMTPYIGSQWWTLTGACIEYVLRMVDGDPSLLRFFRHTMVPDEMFFQTLIMNSEFKNRVVPNNLREINWKPGAAHPLVLREPDFGRLLASDKYFARKFDEGVDARVLSMLDQHLVQKRSGSGEI